MFVRIFGYSKWESVRAVPVGLGRRAHLIQVAISPFTEAFLTCVVYCSATILCLVISHQYVWRYEVVVWRACIWGSFRIIQWSIDTGVYMCPHISLSFSHCLTLCRIKMVIISFKPSCSCFWHQIGYSIGFDVDVMFRVTVTSVRHD